jgi:hypothetical protein
VSLSRLQFREASVADLLQVHDYLQEQATSALADRFLMAVERTGEHIRRYPAAGSLFRPGSSRWPRFAGGQSPSSRATSSITASTPASSTLFAFSTALAMRKGN